MELKLEADGYYPAMHADLRGALERYYNSRIPAGGFLMAVLENDLVGAVGRADAWNKRNIPDIVGYIYNHFPSHAWGSPEKVAAYLEGK